MFQQKTYHMHKISCLFDTGNLYSGYPCDLSRTSVLKSKSTVYLMQTRHNPSCVRERIRKRFYCNPNIFAYKWTCGWNKKIIFTHIVQIEIVCLNYLATIVQINQISENSSDTPNFWNHQIHLRTWTSQRVRLVTTKKPDVDMFLLTWLESPSLNPSGFPQKSACSVLSPHFFVRVINTHFETRKGAECFVFNCNIFAHLAQSWFY